MKETNSFEQLKLLPGAFLQVQAGAEGAASRCHYLGAVPGRYVVILPPKGARWRGGQSVLVKVMLPTGIGMFKATVESVTNLPLPQVYLSYPKSIARHDVRGARRVDTRLSLRAWQLDALSESETGGRFEDMSVTGAKIALSTVLATVGDKLRLQADLSVGGLIRQMQLTAVVRSRIDRSTAEEQSEFPAVYGIEFCDMDDDNKLLLYTYIYQTLVQD